MDNKNRDHAVHLNIHSQFTQEFKQQVINEF